jgi:hypothetical protein
LQNQLDQGGLDIIKTINEANGTGDDVSTWEWWIL